MEFGNKSNQLIIFFCFELNEKLHMYIFQCIVCCCYCHDRLGIYIFLIVLKEADKVGRTERKTWKSTKPYRQTKTERLLCIQLPQSCNQGTSVVLCFTKPSDEQYHNLMQICRVNSGRKEKKGNKTKAERETVKGERDG